MANFQYTADILADSLFRAGEPTTANESDYWDQALTYLNLVYTQICRGGSELVPSIKEDWTWLRKASPGVIILTPPITAGTITATLGSTAATLTTVPTSYTGANISVATWLLKVGQHPDLCHVSAHTAGATALTLDAAFTGSTGAGQSYTLFKVDYELATDVLRVIAPMRTFRNSGWNSRDDYKVYASDLDTMEEQYPMALIEQGIPDYYAMIGETTSGTRRVRFNRCGGGQGSTTTVYRIEYEYLYQPTALTAPGTTEEPVLPRQWRHLLADFTLAFLFGIKHDDRAQAAGQMAQAGLIGMAGENRYQIMTATKNAFRVYPRIAGQRRWGVVRTESGRIVG